MKLQKHTQVIHFAKQFTCIQSYSVTIFETSNSKCNITIDFVLFNWFNELLLLIDFLANAIADVFCIRVFITHAAIFSDLCTLYETTISMQYLVL